MPLLALVMSQMAGSHLSNQRGEFSRMVPILFANCCRECLNLQRHTRRLAMVIGGQGRTVVSSRRSPMDVGGTPGRM